MVTNKGIIIAAVIVSIGIMLHAVILVGMASMMAKKAVDMRMRAAQSAQGFQERDGAQPHGRDFGQQFRGQQGGDNQDDMDDQQMRGQRSRRGQFGMGGQQMQNNQRGGYEARNSRGGDEGDDDENEQRGRRSQRGGGGGDQAASCPMAGQDCGGNGYLFN